MGKYRKYYDEDKDKNEKFTVFIIHGHTKELSKVEDYIEKELRFKTIISQNVFEGKNIMEKIEWSVWKKADCAIAIMSPDDKLGKGNFRARQNVFFELGYCKGIFDSYYGDYYNFEPVLIIKEKSIDFKDVSDLQGQEVLLYKSGKMESTFETLGKALNKIYKKLGGKEKLE